MRPTFIFALLLSLAASAAAGRDTYPFFISVETESPHQNIVARNGGPAPVTVCLSLPKAENLATSQALPVQAVIRPYDAAVLLQVRPANPARPLNFTSESAFHPGNIFARHDPQARYRLPFPEGDSFTIAQAADGPLTTHASLDSQYAVDFAMPEGTPVLAAREGVVIETEAGFRRGGLDRQLESQANLIRILHPDETIGTYAHLAPDGVLVQRGQRIQAGELIGYSGTTGYVAGPHLHFVVQTPISGRCPPVMRSLPIRFYVGDPAVVFEPRTRQRVTADYRNPGVVPPVNEKRAIQAR